MWALAIASLGLLLLLLTLQAFFWRMSHLQRRRIRLDVERRGGELLEAKKDKGVLFDGVAYLVRFRASDGRIVRTVYFANVSEDVWECDDLSDTKWAEWSAAEHAPAAEALDERNSCLACDAEIPAEESRCPRCGWSYRDASSA